MRRKYRNPPINELVIGVYFNEPISVLLAEHIGLYWSIIKHEYPRSAQNMIIGGVEIPAPKELFPLPRFWFISEDDAHLIQVQRNAFLLNWRKREGSYPHYEQLKARFDKNYEIFADFLGREFEIKDVAIGRFELSYINTIEDTPYFRSAADVTNVIPGFSPPIVNHESDVLPTDFNVKYVYPAANDRPLSVAIQSRRNSNTGNGLLYFELRVSGELQQGSKSELDLLFDNAHETIGDAFDVLTSSDVQERYWQPMEN